MRWDLKWFLSQEADLIVTIQIYFFFLGENKTFFPGNVWSQENQVITGEGSFLYRLPSFVVISSNLYLHKKMHYVYFILHFAVYPDTL